MDPGKKVVKFGMYPLLFITFILWPINCMSSELLPPHQAAEAGYRINTFSSYFIESNVDISDTRNPGFEWYIGKFFGWEPTLPENLELLNNKPLIIKTGENANFTIATAARVNGSRKWVGQAFGGGGYFEAAIRFNPSDVLRSGGEGWPSFWAMGVEHLANLPEEQWLGQEKGYAHFIEVDIMEYLFKDPKNPNIYGANIHDWFGVWKETCVPKQFCNLSVPYNNVRKSVPSDTDFNKFHKYGFLWVPAIKEAQGWAQFFFDDKPIGNKVSWSLYEGQSPSLKKQPWTYGVIDQQHLVLILGTGKDQPITVRSVQVWQKSNDKKWAQ